jgi:23S rRNA G2069 N7-methylase RlmK/C1962 C5-methylase RlmI
MYSAPMYQQGHGLGGLFSSPFRAIAPVARAALPAIRKGARTAGYEMLRTAADVAEDVMDGEDIRTATKKQGKQFACRVVKKATKAAKRRVNRELDQHIPRNYIKRRRQQQQRQHTTDIFDQLT